MTLKFISRIHILAAVVVALLASSMQVYAVNGTVYHEFPLDGTSPNVYGTKNNNETRGVAGITITVYPGGDTFTTGTDGTWIIAATGAIRVEFTSIPTHLEASEHGADFGTTVQFVDGSATNVDLGLHEAVNYCQANPDVASPRYVNGDPAHMNGPLGTVMTYAYDETGIAEIADKVETGSLWGVAYDKKRKQLYTSAVLRRHAGIGPDGGGAIYAISGLDTTPSTALLHTVLGVNVDTNTDRGLDGLAATSPNHDSLAFPKIAKAGLGDLEISPNNNTLYSVNLADKLVHTYDLNIAATSVLPAFPDPGCTNGEARPWALKARGDQLYLGVVCSAENGGVAADLQAYVYAYDVSAGSWSSTSVIGDFDLDYPRQNVMVSGSIAGAWAPWSDTLAGFPPRPASKTIGMPTPILSDIEFDDNGHMILGFLDRSGMQFGALNYGPDTGSNLLYQLISGGDTIRAVSNGDGTYTPEIITTLSGAGSEFYKGDDYVSRHLETTYGGLAVLSGSGELMSAGMDPEHAVNKGGIEWLSTETGAYVRGFDLYTGRAAQGYAGKSVGIGDVELLCDPAPIQIGNLVWEDTNNDGIQDANEDSIGSVKVELYKGSTLVGMATTSPSGEYYFGGAGNTNMTGGLPLKPQTDYQIRIALNDAGLGGKSPTTQDAGAVADDIHDSDGDDGVLNSGFSTISYTTESAGVNDHTLDFGFTNGAVPTLDLGDAPNADYPTTLIDNGPSHTLDATLYMGACVDDESDGQPTATADGDDNGAASANTEGNCVNPGDDEDGLTPPLLTDGQVAPTITVAVNNTTTGNAYLACWVDYSGTGFEAGERSATELIADGATSATITLPDVPSTASADTGGTSYLRCRIASTESEIDDPTGAASNGEIEDYRVTINAIPVVSIDLGDAPSSDYPTILIDNGPSHTLDATLYMGACVDDESDGQPTATADGDDNGVASANTEGNCVNPGDDEDGLTPPLLTDGQVAPTITVAVNNTTTGNAYLACWVDYSGTGFEAGERSATELIADGATSATITLPDVPSTASADTGGTSFLRCRIASTESEIDDPTGAASNGEIEDYKLTIDAENAGVTGVVWFDADKDGIKDPDENGLPGWTIEIRDSIDVLVRSLTTQADGTFSDLNLGTGDFTIRFLSPGGIIIQEQNITLNPGDVAFLPEPIDPAGIIYDEQTGDPVPGAQVFLTTDGTPLPVACLGVGEQGQVTGVDGAYMFFINPGVDPACPVADTVYQIQVIPPTDYQTTVNNPPQAGVLDADNCTIDAVAGVICEVSNQTVPPITGIPPYYLLIDIGVGDPGVFNNHIPLTPASVVLPPTPDTPIKPIPTLSEWGRIILMLLIGVITLMQQGRRRKDVVKF